MPRLPVDGTKVKEIRITLGTKERQIAESSANAAQVNAVNPEKIIDVLTNPTEVISIFYSLATIIEIFGVETGFPLPTLSDVTEYLGELELKREIGKEFTGIAKDAVLGEFREYKGNPVRLILAALGVDLNELGV